MNRRARASAAGSLRQHRPIVAGRCRHRSRRRWLAARSRRSRTASQRSSVRHLLHEDPLAAGLVERAQIRVQVRARSCSGRRPGVDPGDVLMRLAAAGAARAPPRAGRRSRARGLRVDLSGGHDGHRCARARSARACCPARAANRASGPMEQLADHLAHLRRGDGARAQQPHALALEGDDRRLESDLALPAIENHAHRIAELLAHVLGACRARGARSDSPRARRCRRRRRSAAAAPSGAPARGSRRCPGRR